MNHSEGHFCDLFQPPVTLAFYLLSDLQVDHFVSLPRVQLVPIFASKSIHSFGKYRVRNLVTDKRTDGRTDKPRTQQPTSVS